MSKTIIIVGGSFAGIKAAWDLRHLLDNYRDVSCRCLFCAGVVG
jgi:NADH dehydrogenase FAD-containing subunit